MKRLKIHVQPQLSDEPKSAFLTIPDDCLGAMGLEAFKRAQRTAYESLGVAVLSMTLVEEIHTEI